MPSYIISACSTADVSAAYFAEKNIPYICYRYIMDGKEYLDDLGKTMSSAEFYRRIAEGAMPTTSQVNTAEYVAFFEPMLAAGNDVLHITLSSGLSGSYSSAVQAVELLRAKYPERKLHVVDSLGASSGYGLLLDRAIDLRDGGMDIDSLNDWLTANRLKVHLWFFSTDLTHFKRGGRISASSAVLGNLLNICPLMNMDNKGHLTIRRKVRGKHKVMREIVEEMEQHAQQGAAYNGKCFISHAACHQDAQEVAKLVTERFPKLAEPVQIFDIGAVIGSHTGPGTVALFFFGDERVD